MIELRHDSLLFSFPDVHPSATLTINFQRTLRIPDDDKTYPLPPGLGKFPLRHVDDHAGAVPPSWLEHGGIMLPMFQSEAMWLLFHPGYASDRQASYPCAIKVAAGKIDAVTGNAWSNGLNRKPQDYMVAPGQPWLDGFCVQKGVIRQFVAAPLGEGYTAEEQITGQAEHGGLQIIVYPMKHEVFERRFPKRDDQVVCSFLTAFPTEARVKRSRSADMGLAPGGKMKQTIQKDPFDFDDWDLAHSSRCFVHIANSLAWRAITGEAPPTLPPTAKQYSNAGLPWFDYYDDSPALEGAPKLSGLQSVAALDHKTGKGLLPENEPCDPKKVVKLGPKGKVREGTF